MHLSLIEAVASREVLLGAAASIALLHTVIGIDHYLPFVVLGRARKWSLAKVALITAACGVGHVIGSIALGAIGIALGSAVGQLEAIESVRGELAAWGLIAFGVCYATWSLIRMKRGARHSHVHIHADGSSHDHEHSHAGQAHREHLHLEQSDAPSFTFWSLFIVFALGPCEPLIPILMAPAFNHDWWLVFEVAGIFAAVTIASMVALALIGSAGLRAAPIKHAKTFERYSGVAAGTAIAASGAAIQFFGI